MTPVAFLLRPAETGLSVYQIDGLTADDVKLLSGKIGIRQVFGVGEVTGNDAGRQGLQFERDDNPLPRHGNLTGWPALKEEQMLIAQELSRAAIPTFY